MTRTPSIPDPEPFGLSSFSDVLPARHPIIGEDPGSFEAFHGAMMETLRPATPYECVIAENLIAIEWELLQRRNMRDDACLRKIMRDEIGKAVVDQLEAEHDAAMEKAWDVHIEAGGSDEDWEEPSGFARDAAAGNGENLATRATSRDVETRSAAYEEITALGLMPVELMSEAYTSRNSALTRHDDKLQELERRRREVRRDLDALHKARPLEATVIDA